MRVNLKEKLRFDQQERMVIVKFIFHNLFCYYFKIITNILEKDVRG
jgi:hypothetical protein